MDYYKDEKMRIRDLEEPDAQAIAAAERAQGWDASEDKYYLRMKDAKAGRAFALVCEYGGRAAGYINVYLQCAGGPFLGMGLPEIVDFGVLEKYRRHGIGTKLMDAAEEIAGRYSDTVCLGVGLHQGYGSAQRMYVKRGYIPDGSGVWYGGKICEPYSACCNDDDLVLYFSKKLKNRKGIVFS